MEWARYEMRRSPSTIARYREALNWVIRDVGDLPVARLVGHIKELLGHERVDTTCRYYLGLDVRAAGEAHRKFLRYE